MIYLRSVDSYYDQQTNMVYTCISETCRDTNEGITLKDMKEHKPNRRQRRAMDRIGNKMADKIIKKNLIKKVKKDV